jgi:hypothetical protein
MAGPDLTIMAHPNLTIMDHPNLTVMAGLVPAIHASTVVRGWSAQGRP